MTPVRNIIVQPSNSGERIDIFLATETGITRSQIQKSVERGDILVNNKAVKPNYRLRLDDVLSLNIIEKKDESLVPEPLPVDILYKDEHLVVVNKPAGMIVYPAAGHSH